MNKDTTYLLWPTRQAGMQATVWDVRCFFFSFSSFLWDLKLRLKKQQLFMILSPPFFFFAPFHLTVNSDPSDQNQRKFHVRHWECLKPAGWWSEHEDVIVGLRPTCLILSPISSSEVCCISHQQSEHVVLWDNKSLINKLLPSCDWSPGPRRLLASVPEIPSGPDRPTVSHTDEDVCLRLRPGRRSGPMGLHQLFHSRVNEGQAASSCTNTQKTRPASSREVQTKDLTFREKQS